MSMIAISGWIVIDQPGPTVSKPRRNVEVE